MNTHEQSVEIDQVDLNALRAVAEAATEGEWVNDPDTLAGRVWVKSRRWWGGMDMEPIFQVRNSEEYGQRAKDALHVSSFDPPTVLALLDRLETAEKRLDLVDGMVTRGTARSTRRGRTPRVRPRSTVRHLQRPVWPRATRPKSCSTETCPGTSPDCSLSSRRSSAGVAFHLQAVATHRPGRGCVMSEPGAEYDGICAEFVDTGRCGHSDAEHDALADRLPTHIGHICLAVDANDHRYTSHPFGFKRDPWRGATILTPSVIRDLRECGLLPLTEVVTTPASEVSDD